MSVNAKEDVFPWYSTGAFTSTACCAVDVTETLGYSPSIVWIILDSSGGSPDWNIASINDTTNSIDINGADGVVTLTAVASGLDITTTGFVARSEIQTASGTNYWFALR